LNLFKQVVTSATKNVATATKKKETKVYVKTTSTKDEKEIKNPRKVEIRAPQGLTFIEEIPFSIERFKKFLTDLEIKSAAMYATGMRRLLHEIGIVKHTMTLNDLVKLRDYVGLKHSKYDSSKRGWIRKFNEYLIYEHTINNK